MVFSWLGWARRGRAGPGGARRGNPSGFGPTVFKWHGLARRGVAWRGEAWHGKARQPIGLRPDSFINHKPKNL